MAVAFDTSDRPGARAHVRYSRLSPSKARAVLDLIRGESIERAGEILRLTERDAANVVHGALNSAVANAEHNEQLDPDELFVAECFADEGPTLKRWRPRARGRATRIRKRTCHITVVVGRYTEDELDAIRALEAARGTSVGGSRGAAEARRRRVAASQGEDADEAEEADQADGAETSDDGASEDAPRKTPASRTKKKAAARKAAPKKPTKKTAVAPEQPEKNVTDAGSSDTDDEESS